MADPLDGGGFQRNPSELFVLKWTEGELTQSHQKGKRDERLTDRLAIFGGRGWSGGRAGTSTSLPAVMTTPQQCGYRGKQWDLRCDRSPLSPAELAHTATWWVWPRQSVSVVTTQVVSCPLYGRSECRLTAHRAITDCTHL